MFYIRKVYSMAGKKLWFIHAFNRLWGKVIEDFVWEVETATKKKKLDCSMAEYLTIDEGTCIQIMHIGPFDDEPKTVSIMDAYIKENGYENDFSNGRLHHEIYLSDARKVAPEKWKTVIRHPIKKLD